MNRDRFKSAPWANVSRDITIGGAGGISSWLALLLARSNQHEIIIYDFDLIEAHNLGGQFFKNSQRGTTKAKAVCDNVNEYCNDSVIYPYEERYEEDSIISNIMIAGFDNMLARRIMYNRWKSNSGRELFIDPRLAAEMYQIYFVQKGQEERYEATLFTDDQAPDEVCTLKATSHFAAMIAGKIVQGLNAYLANQALDDKIYTLPFFVSEVGSLFNVTVEL